VTSAPAIRALQTGDGEALARLLEDHAATEAARVFHPFPLTRDTALRLVTTARADRYWGAWIDGRMVGFAMLRGWDAGFEVPSFGILVDRRFWRRGIGTILTAEALQTARIAGCRWVRLTVYASNAVALRLFDRAGFREVSREPGSAGGGHDTRILMRCALPHAGSPPAEAAPCSPAVTPEWLRDGAD
jgi:ribosomal protein S18 acetylase RimI-like enzyme